ncbi:prolyl oligopeptidase family serine peptidase [Chitinophaga horti]|uniref:Prolyl oligopeptidase family serine peptidase n=1 Tax=Chitinophaga horti TaxID=2920382 RepID=A0ABY6J3C0_9BACT|nr:prolyl oligopeptidase family serine peptidase [Chitinophaga horti]UYQ94137.1 prolyl oligopeptidase family serine peptidase [Chitinophaga horti]
MKKLVLLFIAGCLSGGIALAQKPALDTTAYKLWKRTSPPVMSWDGNWVVYGVSGDYTTKEVHLVNIASGKNTIMPGMSDPTFFNLGKWMKYSVNDSLMLMRMKDGKRLHWKNSSFILTADASPFVTYSNRSQLVVWNVDTNDSTVFAGVSRVTLFDQERSVIYQQDKQLKAGPLKGKHAVVSNGEVSDFSFDKDKQEGTFVAGAQLYYFSLKGRQPQLLLDFNDVKVPAGYQLRQRAYEITPATKQMVLDISSPFKQKPPAKADPNAVDLELWTWNEPVSQRRQRRGSGSRSVMDDAKFVYDLQSKQLAEAAPEFTGQFYAPGASSFEYVLYSDPSPYKLEVDWVYDAHFDIWMSNIKTGERKLVAKHGLENPQWSPNGRFAVLYDHAEKAWMLLNTKAGKFENVSAQIGHPVHKEDVDMVRLETSYGLAGWLNGGNTAVFYDRYDLWAVDLTGAEKPRSLTNGYGRAHNISFRLLNTPYGGELDLSKPLLLQSFNERTKSGGVYRLTAFKKVDALVDEAAYSVKVNAVAGNRNAFLFTRGSFSQYPDLWWANGNMQAAKRLTDINPHQQQYSWGTAKVFEWKNTNGKAQQGLLYVPEHYDPAKKYPVIVNFYETHSDDLHEYFTPHYSTCTIDIPTFVSNGYVVFRPDVHFGVGQPGEDATNAVVSGTRALIAAGIADKDRIGLQGHSFSGFEVAYIATKTYLFKCVNVGAGVVNMTYNYTSMRSNGAPGLFKPEVDQYRIGKTMWEDKAAYLLNSPILNADKITSPLLILHNDKDGAVAFTQGLDLFYAMRRMQKPAWLLNYKGQNHTLEELGPQQDWTARMTQYFDHYLKGKPMPRWMKEGIGVDDRKVDMKLDY